MKDFEYDDIYGESIIVEIGQMIRNAKKFTSVKELTQQIQQDVKVARNLQINHGKGLKVIQPE